MTTNSHTVTSLIDDQWDHFRKLPAAQQPEWPSREQLETALDALPQGDVVTAHDSQRLSTELASLDRTGGLVLQLGDCVEDIHTDVYADTRRKLAFIAAAGDHLERVARRPVLTAGRIAGQYAKPRSNTHELIDGLSLPTYRGPIINAPYPTKEARRPRPENVVRAHEAVLLAHSALRDHASETSARRVIWTSHELLLLDYELQYLRVGTDGNHLATTHWPWIGARTRQLAGAHIAIAASLRNPVSVKIGPDTSPDEVVDLSITLNPNDLDGKLTFIARMGSTRIDQLADLARAVRRHGRHVRWISDPMHGNTVTTAHGLKTRHLEDIIYEVQRFQQILLAENVRPAGIHLEATPDDVHECSENGAEPDDPNRYRSLLDPRLNPSQTLRVLDAWST